MEEGTKEREKDADKTQFQQELNRLFESRGIIADLRSHLRHLMITALQNAQSAELKSTDSSSPKAQALNLMVAEYLFRHKCHYTLSVFTSEVPTLASFNPELVLQGEKLSEPNKRRIRDNCFLENEVEEIFNALGMSSSHSEELEFLRVSYLEKGNQTSLVELFIRAVIEMSKKLHIRHNLESHVEVEGERLLSEQWSKKIIDILLSGKMSTAQVTALEEVIFRITENEVKRVVEKEQRQQMQVLSEREKRIQEYLRKHEDDIFFRLIEAEKDLTRRRDMIDEELTEREKYLTKMAVEWKNKHEEILKLSKNFHDIDKENQDLKKKLKAFQEENINLKTQEKSQSRTINDLKEEMNLLINKLKEVTDSNAILSERVQALINRESKEVFSHENVANQIDQKAAKTRLEDLPSFWSKNVTLDDDSNLINTQKDSSPKVKSKEFTIKNQMTPRNNQWNTIEVGKTNLGSGEAQPCVLDLQDGEDVSSSSSEEILSSVRKKLQNLEEETNRINQTYLEFKLKCIPSDSDSESFKNQTGKSPPSTNEYITKETKFIQTMTEDPFIKLQKLKEKKERKNEFDASLYKRLEVSPRKTVTREPTKRQLQNLDYFLKSRQLLKAFEKQRAENPQSSSSSVVSSTSGSFEDLEETSKKSKNESPVTSMLLMPLVSPTHFTQVSEAKKTLAESERKIECSSQLLRTDEDCLALLKEVRIKSPLVSARKSLRQRILMSETDKEDEEEKERANVESSVASSRSSPTGRVSVGRKSGSDGIM